MKKIILIGLLGGIIVLGIGMLVSSIFQTLSPALKTEYVNPNLFRPWSDPLMMLYFVHPFLLSIILAWIWNKVKVVFTATDDLQKGIFFGLTVWLVSSLPGMLMSYASFTLSLLLVISWTISGLLELIGLGILFSKTLK